MKHIVILFALVNLCLLGGVNAQEQAQESTAIEQNAPSGAVQEAKPPAKKGVNFDIEFGEDEKVDAEKITEIVDLVTKYNSELGEDLKVEVEGLSEEEKAKLIGKLESGLDNVEIPDGAVAISIIAIISVFGLPVFILIVLMASSHRKRKQKMELVNLYIANDKELPEHVINAFDNGGAANSLRSGLVLVAVGVALAGGFGGSNIGNFGLIPLFLGIARLIYWYLEERTPKQQ